MMLMYGSTIFIIMLTGEPRPRPPPLVRALALSRPARLDGGARDERHAHPLVPRQSRPRARSGDGDDRARRRGRGSRRPAPRASSSCPTSPASGRRSTIRMPRACSSASTSPTPAATSTARCSKASPTAPTTSSRPTSRPGSDPRAFSPSAAAPRTASGRRRPRTSRAGRQIVRDKTIGASYGDAFLAALAVGDVKPEAWTWNPVDRDRADAATPVYAGNTRFQDSIRRRSDAGLDD